MQTVIGFGAVLAQVEAGGQIDFLHERSAVAVENLQRLATEKDYVVTLRANEGHLRIDRSTHYVRDEKLWTDAEFYLYGELVNAGGKSSPIIHLDTEEFGVLRIATDKESELIDIPDQNPLISIRGRVPIYGSPGLGVAQKMTEIRDLWEKHSRSEFPHEAYEAEIDFVSIDSFAAGVISSFLESSRALNSDSVIALSRCVEELSVATTDLQGEMKNYFLNLLKLSELVLKAATR